MHPSMMVATARRVLSQLRHDPRTVALMLVVPSLLMGLFAWLFSEQDAIFDSLGGAILALFPFTVMFLVTSITTLRERQSGTLERLMTTPLGKADLILGYALAFSMIAILQSVITVSFAIWVCGLTVEGSVLALGGVTVIDALLGTALGLCTSAFAQTEFQAVQFMPVLVFPQLFLGGIFMPRDEMPRALEMISDWLPLSYAIDAVNAVSAGETGWDQGGPILIIAAFAVGLLVLASLTLRRRTA